MRSLLTLFLLALALTASSVAHASPAAGVVVTGEATMQAPLAAQLEGWLKTHGHDVVASPLEPDAINTLVDCFVIEDEACAKGVVERRAKSELVVFARIDVTSALDGTRDVTLNGYWFAKGHAAVAERKFCERCNAESLRIAADELMLTLSGSKAANTGHLSLASNPSNAHVMIDGHSVGTTPLEFDIAPGQHEVMITADEHQVETRTVMIELAKTNALVVPLVPGHGRHLAGQDGEGGAHGYPLIPVTATGVGAAAVIAGGVMIAIGGPPSKSGPQQHFYTDPRPAGIGVAIGGAVAVGVGVVLWLRHRDEPAPGATPTGAPTVSINHDGGFVGWAGSF